MTRPNRFWHRRLFSQENCQHIDGRPPECIQDAPTRDLLWSGFAEVIRVKHWNALQGGAP